MRLRLFAVVSLAGVLLGQSGPAPSPDAPKPQQQPPSIQVQVNEVIVPVTVTDSKGRFVTDLNAADFKIWDEGKQQTIRFFTRTPKQPVVLGFLIDLSNANRIHWKHFQEAATELVYHMLDDQDREKKERFAGYLISYGNDAELLVNTTNDAEKLVAKIRHMKPGGGAALYDAIYIACTNRSLIKGEPYEPRRVLIVVGDGHDSASKKTFNEVIELAQRNLVTIYGMSTVAYGFSSEGEKTLLRLAKETGGRVMYPLGGLFKDVSGYLSTPSDEGNYAYKVGTGAYAAEVSGGIYRSLAALAGEIETQYIIRYVPSFDAGADPKVFRNIRIEVPQLSSATIRARAGYYPMNP